MKTLIVFNRPIVISDDNKENLEKLAKLKGKGGLVWLQ